MSLVTLTRATKESLRNVISMFRNIACNWFAKWSFEVLCEIVIHVTLGNVTSLLLPLLICRPKFFRQA